MRYVVVYVSYGKSWRPDMFYMENHGELLWRIMEMRYVVVYVSYGKSWRQDMLYMFYMENHGDTICCICLIWRIMETGYVVVYVLYGEPWRPDMLLCIFWYGESWRPDMLLHIFCMENHGDQICCCIYFIWRIMETRYVVVYVTLADPLILMIALSRLRNKIMCGMLWWTVLVLTWVLNSLCFSHNCKNW